MAEHPLYRDEALAEYSRVASGDAAPAFDPGRMRPRWRWLAAGTACLAVLAAAGLLYQVPQGPRGLLVEAADGRAVVGMTAVRGDLVGDHIVLVMADGTEIGGTAADFEQVSGNGVTATMMLVELDEPGAADGYAGESLTVDPERVPLLIELFNDDREGR